jgi:5,5'-dehydrodivanillate O-demethylase
MATTREQNERLTRVGPGTPMGELLRRYWQPIAAAPELEREPVRRVRFLGEDLTLYRSAGGTYGLITDVCPHRCTSLAFGIPEALGLRCAYHGWVFDAEGRCVEQPFEDRNYPEARYKDRVRVTAYPVRELGGMLFAYFGPEPAPLLPHWDVLVRDDLDRMVEIHHLPCNWLQCMDNAADPVHFEYLHAALGNYVLGKLGRPPIMEQAKHRKIAFDVFRYGIMKRRLLEGESEDVDDWQTGHPLLFPNCLAVGPHAAPTLQYRVPIDDENTIQFAYRTTLRVPDAAPKPFAVKHSELFEPDGRLVADTVPKQDMLGWVAQGRISDRTREHLTASDAGVILYHKLLVENMDAIARGEDPLGVIRDPAENEPMVNLRREHKRLGAFAFQRTDVDYFEQIRQLADTH